MIIDCIADCHGHYPKLEGGDLLIIAGDLTARDEEDQYYEFNSWLCDQEYTCKIVIAGNHDNLLQKDSFQYLEGYPCFEYLQDSGTEFEGFKIWGSPWTKTFPGMNPHCKAFTVDTEEELGNKFFLKPHDTDILITHSPPYRFLDKTNDGNHVGSKYLTVLVASDRPKLHVFGHIHESYGKCCKARDEFDPIYVNASIVNERYEHVNKPVRVVL